MLPESYNWLVSFPDWKVKNGIQNNESSSYLQLCSIDSDSSFRIYANMQKLESEKPQNEGRACLPQACPQNFCSVFPIFQLLQNTFKVCTPALLSDALQDKQPIP